MLVCRAGLLDRKERSLEFRAACGGNEADAGPNFPMNGGNERPSEARLRRISARRAQQDSVVGERVSDGIVSGMTWREVFTPNRECLFKKERRNQFYVDKTFKKKVGTPNQWNWSPFY